MKNFVKYAVAVIGSAFIFVAVFFLWGAFVNPLLPGIFQTYIHIGDVGTNNWLGLILGSLAATSSFRSTLKKTK